MQDLISRQAAIREYQEVCKGMKCGECPLLITVNTEKGSHLITDCKLEAFLHDLPSAQPQLDTCPIYGGMCGYPSNLCYECPRHEGAKERPQWWTEGLQPFAQPQRIKGRWIHDGYDIPHGVDWMHCSVCGRREPHVPAAITNFCPTCGSDMRGGDNE